MSECVENDRTLNICCKGGMIRLMDKGKGILGK